MYIRHNSCGMGLVLCGRYVLPPLSHGIVLDSYAEVHIPFDSDTMLAGPVDVKALDVMAVPNPMPLICSFLKFSSAFMEHKDVCAPLR